MPRVPRESGLRRSRPPTSAGTTLEKNDRLCIVPNAAGRSPKAPPAAKTTVVPANVSEKDWLTSVLLCFFLGSLGIHSFYAGKTGIGIAQLLTMGGCGVWTLIDFIMLLCGSYKDSEGKAIVNK